MLIKFAGEAIKEYKENIITIALYYSYQILIYDLSKEIKK